MPETEEDFAQMCRVLAGLLTKLGDYLDNGEKELTEFEMQWLSLVVVSYHYAVNSGDGDGDSDYRVDDTLY